MLINILYFGSKQHQQWQQQQHQQRETCEHQQQEHQRQWRRRELRKVARYRWSLVNVQKRCEQLCINMLVTFSPMVTT
ncbi:hypothetical protein K450DRAFT_237945 [Umbelopsis ramanniana AG]|uniref:Uncharacterized protein n=1 Tax=Umbelopsis ramanniana AG TaxID=1314678 RepID=A0AAD5EAB8_UMBRA|nr:uncharacterized protein K450DRAFT_237945 [Umbelopsis ramanniana AG]KAI8580318.1 hypothetical protein K450DRAFT_237945 [Umbelopsis ramanniana AG]